VQKKTLRASKRLSECESLAGLAISAAAAYIASQKPATKLLVISLSLLKINLFSKCFHWHVWPKISHKTVIVDQHTAKPVDGYFVTIVV